MVLHLESGTEHIRKTFTPENSEIGNSWILTQEVRKANGTLSPKESRKAQLAHVTSLSLAPALFTPREEMRDLCKMTKGEDRE